MFRTLLVGASLLLSTTARAEWHEASSKHFVVYSDDREADLRNFAEQLERFDQAMRAWHVTPEDKRGDSARVTVFVVKDVAAIQKLAGRSRVAGFYNARAGNSVAFTPRVGAGGGLSSRAILFHEYAHHWMLTNWTDAALPPWFVEGFAELHATALFRDGAVIFGANPSYRKYTVGETNLLPTSRLLLFNPGKLSPYETDALYSRGWLLTHYLTFDEERRKQLAAYVTALNQGTAGDAARLIGDGSNLDLRLTNYARRPRLSSAAFSYDQLPIGEVRVRQLSAAEAAIMPAVMASNRGVDQKQAESVAALARRLAAPYPNDAFVQNELAEAEFDRCSTGDAPQPGCFAAAEAAADRAIAADPRSVHALIYKGMAQVQALQAGKVTDATRWAAARKWFLTANKVDPEAPQPLIAFYDSFNAAGQAPSENARAGLLYAYALAPYDGSLRRKAAKVFLTQGKVAEATVAITPIAYDIEDQAGAERARKVLDAMNSGAPAALAEWDRQDKATKADNSNDAG